LTFHKVHRQRWGHVEQYIVRTNNWPYFERSVEGLSATGEGVGIVRQLGPEVRVRQLGPAVQVWFPQKRISSFCFPRHIFLLSAKFFQKYYGKTKRDKVS
jgi:hypothetical protein